MTDDRRSGLAASLNLALLLHAGPRPSAAPIAEAMVYLGRADDALVHLTALTRTHPRDPVVWLAHATALRALGDRHHALASVERTLDLAPDWPAARANHGLLLLEMGNAAAAVASLEETLARQPDNLDALLACGDALMALVRPDAALVRYDQAIALRPGRPSVRRARAAALNSLDRLTEARDALLRLIADGHGTPADRFHVALTRLSQGDFAVGWRDHEARWELPGALQQLPETGQRFWQGTEDVAGRRVLLHPEQGLGDTLQFCRYAPLLAARGAQVLLRAPQPLARILGTLAGVSDVLPDDAPLPAFDLHCPLMSLPLGFGTDHATIPGHVPYLHADPDAAGRWRARLAPLSGLRVSLVWAGEPRAAEPGLASIDRQRSLALHQLAPLGVVPGVQFVSLQKGGAATQAAAPPAGMTLHVWTDELDDFADTAALVSGLDLVIGVDTSVVHLAGALGRPVWVLNRFAMCWRWLRGRTDSPWYPTARLFRQPAPGDWDSVMEEVVTALREFARDRSPGPDSISPAS